ncbi:hypothetical protein [Deinococcus peraridilitoris]|uniref:Uncharacterized protein n=1 Tax=Deinococcus peraridilitoris (strain DSM 19664 / LMG 22246 / CIP 109416 / KR-200) TaxID=937777 RepID=L0A7I2_DEIPD|nr:hypothetical protein [Deinococcus peraridilitoris]AFZ69776.1 hypothetical protein Deipe_4448 [Deinococcus peraridilitoris DSM 19664]
MYDLQILKYERGYLFGGLSLEELRARFEELRITPPAGLLDALADDQRLNAGNERRTW